MGVHFKKKSCCLIIVLGLSVTCSDNINLPVTHLPYYFNLFPDQLEKCQANPDCPFKVRAFGGGPGHMRSFEVI